METKEIRENLEDAGCSADETAGIMKLLEADDFYGAEKLIRMCRKHQLDKIHESQRCIDRLDYLVYRMERTTDSQAKSPGKRPKKQGG